mgnify:CR=1 FL=1
MANWYSIKKSKKYLRTAKYCKWIRLTKNTAANISTLFASISSSLLVSDTLLISDYADMFIYVVSADGVDKRQLLHVAKPLFEGKRLPNMTMLLNGVKPGPKGYGYGYGYGDNPSKKKKWYKFS